MSRTWAIVRREFVAMVATRAFLFGTLFGPVVMVGLIALQAILATMGGGGGERIVMIVDSSAEGLGERVAAALAIPAAGPALEGGGTRFAVELHPDPGLAGAAALHRALRERIEDETLDGLLWLPVGTSAGEAVLYEGRNATNLGELERIRAAVQTAVQEARLVTAGIDPARVAGAMQPIAFDARKTGGRVATGAPVALFVLTYVIGLSVYMAVLLYGNAVLRGVLEEKRDRIVEVVLSSVRADQLLVGKVLGIGAAGILQMLAWLGCAALLLARGRDAAARFGIPQLELPHVPLSAGVVLLTFFLGGFLLYAAIFAAMGAIATTDQEAQQLQIPVALLLFSAISMMMPVLNDPAGPVAVAGSLIPFTAPVVVPMRAVLLELPLAQLLGALASVAAGAALCLWGAAKIYRIGLLATGKRASLQEIWRWVRAA